jgi:hypothetical protein
MRPTLYEQLLLCDKPDNDELLDRFLAYVDNRHLTLYPAQESAILELFEEKNVILNTPTGSGKSLVAMAAHFKALAQGKRSVYTCPVKALVNEKWLTLCREFGPDNVGLCTGDASVNRDAPILCCTAEILANIALREGQRANVQDVVMDEFHYYADRERGVAWQVPLLTLVQARFLLMSATLGETSFFEEELTRLTSRPTISVVSSDRPVPLVYSYSVTLLSATIESLVAQGKAPVYVVHFTQLEAAQNAQNFTSLSICTREEKDALAEAVSGFKFNSPYGPDIRRWLRQGIGIHHAGLLPKYRVLVEHLAQQGLLKIICGTDTLGVGINVPIRTVLLTRLCKYDGQKTGFLSARDFHQISGRAGRKGFDDCGWVVAQAPEHTIENAQLEQKRAQGGKKFVKRRPPEKNFVNWDIHTFNRLVAAKPEQLVSRFQVTHGMLLNVLSRTTDGCAAMRDLIARCHETQKQKQAHVTRAWQLFRSLVNRAIVEFTGPTPLGAKVRVNIELQDDFSMDQALSLYLLETLPLLDAQAPDYPFRVLTLIESILEDPDFILRKQLDRLKTQKMAAMKAEGIPFDERIEELDKLEYPKPDRDFVYSTFNEFSDRHPWVGQENIRPKSIVREMFETYSSFADYVRSYDLQRAEGVLLRHVNGVFKVLGQTVPETAKNDVIDEMEVYLRTMIRQVDSSLLDEWEKMRDPSYLAADAGEVRPPGADAAEKDITFDAKKFTALVRARIFTFISALIKRDFEAALEVLDPDNPSSLPEDGDGAETGTADPAGSSWTPKRLGQILETFLTDHGTICLDPDARNIRHTYVTPLLEKKLWLVQQMLVDPDKTNDWVLEFEVDCARSRESGEPLLRLSKFGSLE